MRGGGTSRLSVLSLSRDREGENEENKEGECKM